MSSRCCLGRRSVLLTVLVCGTWFGTRLDAQRAPASANVAAESIKCWWKTDKDAVLIGEQFTLTLTCGVVENSRTKVAADAKQFEPTALALAPFEVLGGTPHEDIQDPPWRYFQREYRMRLLGETFFGQDVDIPALKITYGLRSATTGEAEGRDQAIVLPALPMRVQSLVSKNAHNIRDGSTETFGDIETRLSQARSTLDGRRSVLRICRCAARAVGPQDGGSVHGARTHEEAPAAGGGRAARLPSRARPAEV